MSKKHGQATIRINGRVFESRDQAELMVGGLKNNADMIGDKHFYSQTKIASNVKCTVPFTSETELKTLQEMTEAEVIFESDTGKSWIIRDAVQVAELNLQGGEGNGTVDLEFSGSPAEEV